MRSWKEKSRTFVSGEPQAATSASKSSNTMPIPRTCRGKNAWPSRRWWKGLWPLLEQERQTLVGLRGVGVHLQFNEARIPDKRDHQALARELMQVIQLAAARAVPGRPADVVFGPQATIEKATHLVPDYHFLPEEKWPLASKYVSSLSVSRWPIDAWVPWNCLNVMGAWVGPDKNEFAHP